MHQTFAISRTWETKLFGASEQKIFSKRLCREGNLFYKTLIYERFFFFQLLCRQPSTALFSLDNFFPFSETILTESHSPCSLQPAHPEENFISLRTLCCFLLRSTSPIPPFNRGLDKRTTFHPTHTFAFLFPGLTFMFSTTLVTGQGT